MYISRSIEKTIIASLFRREYIALIWPRQVGKTTFIQHLRSQYPQSSYYNLEDPLIRWEIERNPLAFISAHIRSDQKQILFLDEFQYVWEAGSILKLIFDTFSDQIQIIITGSSSLHLREIGAKMVGRILVFEMQSLSVDEILSSQNPAYSHTRSRLMETLDLLALDPSREQWLSISELPFLPQIRQSVDEYMIWGGMPAVIVAQGDADRHLLLSQFTQNYINKDIVSLLRVRNIEKFSTLMISLSLLIGQQLVMENLSRDLGIHLTTLWEYMSYLDMTYVVRVLTPYHQNLMSELKKQKIEYFYDIGIRNYLIKNFNPLSIRSDNGHLLENYVLLRILTLSERYLSLHYWRDKHQNEVDFVIKTSEHLIPLEIKYQNKMNPPLTTGMRRFNELYHEQIPYSLIITKDLLDMREYEGKKYYYIPYYMI